MSTIYQADQYYIPFLVEQDGKVITPDDVDGIRISLGGIIKSYPDGDLLFVDDEWLFKLEAKNSQMMIGEIPCQIEVKKGTDRQHSPVFSVDVKKSVLKGAW